MKTKMKAAPEPEYDFWQVIRDCEDLIKQINVEANRQIAAEEKRKLAASTNA